MIGRESFDQVGGEFEFAVHEDPLVGHEHVFDDDHRLLPAVLGVADIDIAVFHRPRVARLPAVDEGQARIVDRDRADNRVILVVLVSRMVGMTSAQWELMQPVW